jgi:hypothetical protein
LRQVGARRCPNPERDHEQGKSNASVHDWVASCYQRVRSRGRRACSPALRAHSQPRPDVFWKDFARLAGHHRKPSCQPVQVDPASTPGLRWRRRVDRVVDDGDIHRKQGDELPARLYVIFDYPIDRLPLIERSKIQLARSIAGELVPAAPLCYIWDADLPEGTTL